MALKLPSVARWYDPFLFTFVAIITFTCLHDTSISNLGLSLALIGSVTCVMVILELQRANHGPRPTVSRAQLYERCAIKWLGVMGSICGTLIFWWLFPLYHKPDYQPLFDLIPTAMILIAIMLIPYLLYTEWRLGEYNDYAWQIGSLLIGRHAELNKDILRDSVFSILVRAIFLPLNFCYVTSSIQNLRVNELGIFSDNFPLAHASLMSMIYMALIINIVPGYVISSRLINTHMRNIDRSLMGWMVTLICYPPLVSGVFGQLLNYQPLGFENPFMEPWIYFFEHSTMLYVFASLIILMEIIHWWGESILGIRASNLTHRGVITNGIFRYTRHPIYVSKCIGWCLISVPFMVGDNFEQNLRYTLLFGGVCLIYFLRSWVEEKLFADDPIYIEYALWVDKNGWFAELGKHFPCLTFAWRQQRWQQGKW